MPADNDWDALCLICTNPLPVQEKNFKPCPCGFRMCVWCWHKIVTIADGVPAQCPHCRENMEPMTAVQPLKTCAASRIQRHLDVQRLHSSKRPLVDAVAVDSRVVAVCGIDTTLSRNDLQSHSWFGSCGRVLALSVSQLHGVAYIRFASTCDAESAFEFAKAHCFGVSRGLAKWCLSFLRGDRCTKPFCIDLHEMPGPCVTVQSELSAARTSLFEVAPAISGPATFHLSKKVDCSEIRPLVVAASLEAPKVKKWSSRRGKST